MTVLFTTYRYLTCDFIGGKPEHRSTCRAAVHEKHDQGDSTLPAGWVSRDGGHLCPDHADQVPTKGHVSQVLHSQAVATHV